MNQKKSSRLEKLINFASANILPISLIAASPFIVSSYIDSNNLIGIIKKEGLVKSKELKDHLYIWWVICKPALNLGLAYVAGNAADSFLGRKLFYSKYPLYRAEIKKVGLGRHVKSRFYFFKGRLNKLRGNISSEIENYKKAIENEPTAALPYYQLFQVYFKNGMYKEGLEAGQNAIKYALVNDRCVVLGDMYKLKRESQNNKEDPIPRLKLAMISLLGQKLDDSLGGLAMGKSSLVLLNEDSAWKFSAEIKKEADLIGLIKESKNIIIKKSDIQKDIALELEYIQGNSLENIIRGYSILSSEKILRYSSGIMNGLIEMRKAGIYYHRDIRPANILIDEENDRAVIADLGIASTDRHALPKDNRRYGGINDLISLGQVMYKMATGTHLFANSPEMERTVYAEKIKTERDRAYENPELLEKYIKKVDENIFDEKVRTLIKSCLTAKNYDYGKIQKMFKGCAR